MTKQNRSSKRRAVTYKRYSRLAGRDRAALVTFEQQDDTIDDVVSSNGLKVVAEYDDENTSGGTLNRPGFQAALAMIERGEADVIVVSRLSRFARSVPDTLAALERIHAAGGALIAGDLNVDVRSSSGRLMLTLLAAFAEFERELKREDWLVATTKSISNGVRVGKAPTGYVKRTREKLFVDEKLAPVIVESFELRAAGRPWREVRENWHARTGTWRAIPSLAAMIRNRVYLGELRYGGIVHPDAHDAIVDVDLFERAQTDERKPRGPRGAGSLLAGVLYCGSCGRRMTSGGSGGHKGGVYVCQRRQGKGNGTCKRPVSIAKHRVDEYVERALLAWASGYVAEPIDDVDVDAIANVDAQIAKLELRRTHAQERLADVDEDDDTLLGALEVIGAKLAALRAEREQLVDHSRVESARETFESSWTKAKEAGDVVAMRHVVASAVDRVTIAPTSAKGKTHDRHASIESRVDLRFRQDGAGDE